MGRNDPCWCGSGKKYKKCHLGREHEPRPETWEIGAIFRKMFAKQVCSASEHAKCPCSKKIIKAHTVPKQSLKDIAEDGHVFVTNNNFLDLNANGGSIDLKLEGIGRASTFSGFCQVHDDLIFAPLEKKEFGAHDEQCFLLAYRAFARELYCKEAVVGMFDQILGVADRGRNFSDQVDIQGLVNASGFGHAKGLEDLRARSPYFHEALQNSNFNGLHSLIFELDAPPPLMASGATNPIHDFKGNELQDLGDLERLPDLLFLSSFSSRGKGWIVFSWIEGAKSCEQLAKSLQAKSSEEQARIAIQFIVKSLENITIAPIWWNGLPENLQTSLRSLFHDSVDVTRGFDAIGMQSAFLSDQFPRVVNTFVHGDWA